MEILRNLAIFLGGYLIALMMIYMVGSKKPNYKYFTNKEGKKMRVNMNLVMLMIPGAIGVIAILVLFIIALVNYGNL